MSKRALLVVDVQWDFCPGGALAVEAGDQVAEAVARDLLSPESSYEARIATRDSHVDPGSHFADTPDYESSWPAHCIAGTHGAELHAAIEAARGRLDEVFDKGAYGAAYSGFEAASSTGESLGDWLAARQVGAVDVVGIATDYCVRATALDASTLGFETRLLLGYTAAVAEVTTARALAELSAAGVEIVGEATANGLGRRTYAQRTGPVEPGCKS